MIYLSANGEFNFLDYFTIKSYNKTEIPSKRVRNEYVIGRDGSYSFEDGLNDIEITIELETFKPTIQSRIVDIREMKRIILSPGYLISSIENDIIYTATVATASTDKIDGIINNFSVTFTCKPKAVSRLTKEKTTWDQIDIAWDLISIPWGSLGAGFEFSVSNGDITVSNYGNYDSNPIIKINGAGDITISANGSSFTYAGLEDSVYIDNDNMIVYNTAGDNRIQNFSGDFIYLKPGQNTVTIIGTADIEFINKDIFV